MREKNNYIINKSSQKGAEEAKSRDQLILYTAETKHFETIVTCRYIFELFYWWVGSFYELFLSKRRMVAQIKIFLLNLPSIASFCASKVSKRSHERRLEYAILQNKNSSSDIRYSVEESQLIEDSYCSMLLWRIWEFCIFPFRRFNKLLLIFVIRSALRTILMNNVIQLGNYITEYETINKDKIRMMVNTKVIYLAWLFHQLTFGFEGKLLLSICYLSFFIGK